MIKIDISEEDFSFNDDNVVGKIPKQNTDEVKVEKMEKSPSKKMKSQSEI